MRLTKPRIEPLEKTKVMQVLRELFGAAATPNEKSKLNITGLWAKHPKLMSAQRNLQKHIFLDSTLSPRIRELAILRIGWRCNSGYELAQHAKFGMEAGLDRNDLIRITKDSNHPEWTPIESAIVRAADEMFDDAFVSTQTWNDLSKELNEQQLLDLLSIVGRYWAVSVVLNSTGLQLEEGTLEFDGHLSETAG